MFYILGVFDWLRFVRGERIGERISKRSVPNERTTLLTMRSSVLVALVLAVCLGSKVNYSGLFRKAMTFHVKSTPVRNPFVGDAMSTHCGCLLRSVRFVSV